MAALEVSDEQFEALVLELKFLGPLEVRVGSEPISANAWQRIDAKRLLCALVLKPHHRASRDELCQQLFPGVDKFSARSKLSNTLYSLRKALGAASERVVASAHVVELLWGSSVRWDVERFEQCLDAAACCADVGEKADELEQALSLYRGELLQDAPVEPWFAQDRTLLHTRMLWALDALVALYSGQDRLAKAIDCQRQRVDITGASQDQAGHAKLIAMLVEAGRLTEAGAHYKHCRALLATELGEAPSEALQALYHQIKAYDAAQAHAIPVTLTAPVKPLAATVVALVAPPVVAPTATTAPVSAAPLGRDQDAAAVLALLLASEPADELNHSGRLVTLTGFGGVGKTTLARHLMQRWRAAVRALELESSEAGVAGMAGMAGAREPYTVFIDASEMATVEVLAERLVHALGVPIALLPIPAEPIVTSDELAALAGLIVVDNYEHLVDQAPILSTLGAHCPGLTVLVTSRIPLRLKHEQSYPVAPLKIATDAVALFVKRARARNPKLRFDSETLAVVTSICSRLDGLPLAIELAAARCRLFSPQELLARLTTDLKLLRSLPTARLAGDQSGAGEIANLSRAAHGSLWEILAWTIKLLSPRERALLVWLNVFQGGFTLSAVETVFAAHQDQDGDDHHPPQPHIETTDLFERLIDHQLIVPMERLPWVDLSELDEDDDGEVSVVSDECVAPPPPEEQRWMLLETVKQFVSSELTTKLDPLKTANAAHAKYFIDTMRALIDSDPHSDATSLFFTHESNNLLAALEVQFARDPQGTLDPLLQALVRWANRGLMAEVTYGWISQLKTNHSNLLIHYSLAQREMLEVAEILQLKIDRKFAEGMVIARTVLARNSDGAPLTYGVLEACAFVTYCDAFVGSLHNSSSELARCKAIQSQLKNQACTFLYQTNFLPTLAFSLIRAGRFAEYDELERALRSKSLPANIKQTLLDCASVRSSKRGDLDGARLSLKKWRTQEKSRHDALASFHLLTFDEFLALDNDDTQRASDILLQLDQITGLPLNFAESARVFTMVLRYYVSARCESPMAMTPPFFVDWSKGGFHFQHQGYWYLAATVLLRNIPMLTISLERLLSSLSHMSFIAALRVLETLGCAAIVVDEPQLAHECFLMSHEGHDRNEFVLSVVQRSERVALGVPLRIETNSTVYREMPIEMFSGSKFWEHIEPTVRALHEKGKQLVAAQEGPTPPRLSAQR